MLQLYTYFRSSAAWRVRIALNLKGLPWEAVPVHLVQGGGQQHAPEYRALNASGLVPLLVDGDLRLSQSLAIVEYIDETHPTPPLLPSDAIGRARVRAIAQTIACDLHPIDNLRVLRYLEHELGVAKQARQAWYQHWVREGFDAVERLLSESPHTGRFCHGDEPGLADCCVVPQVFNAERFGVSVDAWPTIARIAVECASIDAFVRAAPAAQIDAE